MSENMRIPIKILTSVLAAYIVTAIMLLILSFLMYKKDVSDIFISAGLVAAYVISNISGGFLAGKTIKKRRILWGLVCGIVYIIIYYVISNSIGANNTIDNIFLPAVLSISGGIIGAALS